MGKIDREEEEKLRKNAESRGSKKFTNRRENLRREREKYAKRGRRHNVKSLHLPCLPRPQNSPSLQASSLSKKQLSELSLSLPSKATQPPVTTHITKIIPPSSPATRPQSPAKQQTRWQ